MPGVYTSGGSRGGCWGCTPLADLGECTLVADAGLGAGGVHHGWVPAVYSVADLGVDAGGVHQ